METAFEILNGFVDAETIFDGVFGLQIIPPPLNYEEWVAWCEEHGGVMTVEEAQAEYQEYLKTEILRMRDAVDVLLADIDTLMKTADPELRAELAEFKRELYWAVRDESGKIIEEGGLRTRLNDGLWILENYNFYTKQLEYLIPLEGREEWIEKITKMTPEEVLSEAYYPTTTRLLITLPDLGERRLTS